MNSILTVTTPATATALTTIERVKLELSIINSDSDALLEAKIAEASSDIAVRVWPSLKRETLSEIFWGFAPGPTRPLILSRYPVASIASATLDEEVVDAAEYRIEPETGLLYRLNSEGYPSSWCFSKSAIVAYVAGYLLPGEAGRDLPPALEGAAIELVSSYWRSRGRDPNLRSETNFGVSEFSYWVGAVGAAGELPPGVMAKIGPFLRRGFL